MTLDVWLYRNSEHTYALTIEPAGANLPEHLGPWTFQKSYRLDPSLDDEAEAVRLIEEYGFVCF